MEEENQLFTELMSIIRFGQCGHNVANVDTKRTYSGQCGHNVDKWTKMWTK